jgi:hypothetical protein
MYSMSAFLTTSRLGTGKPQLDRERTRNEHDQRNDERFDVPKPPLLHEQNDEHVERRQADAPDQRQAEEQVEGDGRSDDLGEVARRDGDFADDPQADRRRP